MSDKTDKSESDSGSPPKQPKRRGRISIRLTIVIEWASDFFGHLVDWFNRLFRGRAL